MAAAFRPVNPLNLADYRKDTHTMMTSSQAMPRPNTVPQPQPEIPKDDGKTPTRVTFGVSNDIYNQQSEQAQTENANSSATTSPNRDSMDVDMEDSDNEAGDDNGGSDGESINGDGTKSKKKKSQRFYCTDYPPCNLSFTRSEHLARHIRYVSLFDGFGFDINSILTAMEENTRENAHFSATALDAFLDWTTFASTLKPCMSTKTFLWTLLPPLVLDFSAKCALIEFDRLETEPEHRQVAAPVGLLAATPSHCQRRASTPSGQ